MRIEPGSTLHFEFPALPDTLASMLTGDYQLPRLTATLPDNYHPDGRFPLLVFLLPYGRGEQHPPTRDLVGKRDFICVHMPTFKHSHDKDEPHRGMLVSMGDFQTVSHAYRTMLQKLFETVPNIEAERSALGGFSNGGLTTAMLLAGQDEFILRHFRSFFFVEGANPLAANVLHKPVMRRNRYLIMRGNDFNGAAVREAEFHLDCALAPPAREYGLDLTLIIMNGAKHEFPDEYVTQLGQWIRGEKLPQAEVEFPGACRQPSSPAGPKHMNSCSFCEIAASTQEADRVIENADFLCISPLVQEVPGHTVIVSKAHYSSLLDAPSHVGVSLIEACQSLALLFKASLGATAFNLLSANGAESQQSVMHLHFHFLPRRVNDGIDAWPSLPGAQPVAHAHQEQ